MPAARLLSYLRLTSASLAQIDVIVCNADAEPGGMPHRYESLFEITAATREPAVLAESLTAVAKRKSLPSLSRKKRIVF